MTFAYSFSAPTATIAPEPDGPAARDEEQALASSATPSVMRAVSDLRWLRIADAPRCGEAVGSDENDNDSQYLSQPVRSETRSTGSDLVRRAELLHPRADAGPGAFVSGVGQRW